MAKATLTAYECERDLLPMVGPVFVVRPPDCHILWLTLELVRFPRSRLPRHWHNCESFNDNSITVACAMSKLVHTKEAPVRARE